jgi:hypothetical protein
VPARAWGPAPPQVAASTARSLSSLRPCLSPPPLAARLLKPTAGGAQPQAPETLRRVPRLPPPHQAHEPPAARRPPHRKGRARAPPCGQPPVVMPLTGAAAGYMYRRRPGTDAVYTSGPACVPAGRPYRNALGMP